MADLEFIVTSNEVEALILEANLIKRFHPPYNIEYRDDKSYPYLAIFIEDEFPRVMFLRGQRRKGVLYYGPFAHAGAVRETIETLRKIFPFRSCRGREPGKDRGGPCLDYHLKRCLGPCTGQVSPEEYRKVINSVREFLEGDHDKVITELERKMREEASRQEFEMAARTRDKLTSLRRMLEKQQAQSTRDGDQDVFSLYHNELDACVTGLFIRGGRMLGKRDFLMGLPLEETEGDILSSFLEQYYSQATYVPREIILSHPLEEEDRKLLESWLKERRGGAVRILHPKRGEKRRLAEKALENARHALELYLYKQSSDLNWISRATSGLQSYLGLPSMPFRIECYDISNLGPDDAVGSMAVFEGGLPLRRDYRRFTIKGVRGQNDTAMIGEVVRRRLEKLAAYERAVEKGDGALSRRDSFYKRPDLIVVDGGRAQLNAARKAAEETGFQGLPIVSLAKRLEEVYREDRVEPLRLPRDSEALHLLQRIRDEAHAYALEYHRARRTRRARQSVLDRIPGVGAKRKKLLLQHFGSVTRMAEASLEELESLSFLDKRTARNIYLHLGGIIEKEKEERGQSGDKGTA
jgi:excinuclease ABC subunit C